MNINQKSFGVFGLGKAGKAAVKFLVERGAHVCAWDDGGVSVDGVQMLSFGEWNWEELEALVLSPGVPLTHPEPHSVVKLAQSRNCPIICDVELLYRANSEVNFIGITGTNGKSTTTALIHHMLESSGEVSAMGGNIGVAACDLPALSTDESYILEMSSYQLDLIDKIHFNTSVMLNITPDHLARHGGIDGYIAAKQHIYDNQKKGDIAVISVDDENCKNIYDNLQKTEINVIPISGYKRIKKGVSVVAKILYDDVAGQQFSLGELPYLPGQHNAQNIAAAYAVACQIVQNELLVSAIQTFRGLKHRLEVVAKNNDVLFVNDSKATNDVATEQGLKAYENIFWIVGGVSKEGGIASLVPFFSHVSHAFLIGEAQDEFAEVLKDKVCFSRCGTIEEAVKQAYDAAQSQSVSNSSPVVLLSPACASFDQFPNFEARGDAFVKLVEKL